MSKPFRILSQLQSVKFPISIWWEHAASDLPASFLKKEDWAFFNSTFGKNPAKTVGKYLLQKGIQKVLYVSPYHASSWSKDSQKGLEESGLEVISRVDAKYASPWDFRQLELENGPKHTIDLRAKNHEKNILRELVQGVSEVDAWVTVNDETAALLLELEEEGAISHIPYMVGFDNSVDSYLLRLDSFEFNTEVLVSQMFYHLELGKNDPFKSHRIREISGKVVEK
jgi:DNA-binding LacI/PurR family transcriptional regulator